MSRLDDLPADQKATLQLLLKQGKSYEELGTLLRLEPDAVRDRALNALDALGPGSAGGLTPSRQDEISDYLLGQQTASERAATRSFLGESKGGRTWARAVAAELRPFAGDNLPEIPAEAAEIDEAFGALSARTEARERQEQSSRIGGVLLLLGAAAIVAVLVILIVSRLGGNDSSSSDSASSDTTTTQADTTSTASTTSSTAGNGGIELQIPMQSANGGQALAAGFLLRTNGERVLGINGQNFPPTDGKQFNYAVWLYTSPAKAFRLGFVGAGVPATGPNKGRLQTGADPDQIEKAANASKDPKVKAAGLATAKAIRTALANVYAFKELIITKEPAGSNSTKPGQIVVSGPIVRPATSG
ncbi:hypothetical protein NBH00_16030 [Paraconexibacter antarcticus]|uniref:RNA polymerase sigma factor 70 region 4 type 2 domain-containing protein n=1 Tax=Paraconexibacter antarcticus TaxID=2949664 RepID=A0ABY5DQ69_9ACTN|nr:hypothetical protein [Paraconexibacter antarcticus]UTI62865.1 hypothetical protein NBH00_16030 [Paraconexibacter antarcticus]